MKVVLLQDVKALGKRGDVVEVKEGYAKNMLLPKKLGIEATPKALNDLKLQKANEAKKAQELLDAAKNLAEELAQKQVVVKIKAGEGGKLFGAIASKEIAAAVKEQYGLEVDKKKIVLEDPIKELGTHTVKVKLHKDVTAQLTVKVTEE